MRLLKRRRPNHTPPVEDPIYARYRNAYANRPQWADTEPCPFPYCPCRSLSGDPLQHGCPAGAKTAEQLQERVDAPPDTPTIDLYEKMSFGTARGGV